MQYPIIAILAIGLKDIIKLRDRFAVLEKRSFYSQKDSEMLFKCMKGCLKGLVQIPETNGETVSALKDLEEYINKKAAGLMDRQ
jgi:hypothetical protein